MLAVVKERSGPGLGLAIDYPDPVRQPGEALLRPILAGVCGTDLHIEAWEGPYRDLAPFLPFVLGHEFMAEVVEGERFSPGQRVVALSLYGCGECDFCRAGKGNLCVLARPTAVGMAGDGGMAQLLALPERRLLPVPEGVSDVAAALTEPFATAVRAVTHAPRGLEGRRIAVLGPGTIGLMVALMARLGQPERMVVAGAEGDEERLDLARSLGMETVELSRHRSIEALISALGGPADLVFEAAGAPAAVETGLDVLAPEGVLVVIGMHGKPVPLNLGAVVRGERLVAGSYASALEDWETALQLQADADIVLDPLAGPIFDLMDAAAAFRAAERGAVGRVLLRCNA